MPSNTRHSVASAYRYDRRRLPADELRSVCPTEVVGADAALGREQEVGEVRAEGLLAILVLLEGLAPVGQVLARDQVVLEVGPPEVGLCNYKYNLYHMTLNTPKIKVYCTMIHSPVKITLSSRSFSNPITICARISNW